jgi:hypothetical protein
MMVRRACYMTKSDLGTLLTVGGLYTRALEVKFTLISKLGYTSYSHLKELALNDDRFAGVGV